MSTPTFVRHKTIYTTERSHYHQQSALAAAPAVLDITMLRQPDQATLLTHLGDSEYLISERVGVINAELVQAAPKLKLILRLGALTYDIDTAAAQAAGIAVCYWPQGGVIRVAEHVVMQLLALSKKLPETSAIALAASEHWGVSKRTDEDTFAYNWSRRKNVLGLWQATIGILGFGEIGAELARRLAGWEVNWLYHKRRRLPASAEQTFGLNYVDFDSLIASSDYLVCLLPYFPATDLLLNAAIFAQMKQGAYLVSCGSGSVIYESDLADALQRGQLAGAALDTFEWEPLQPQNPLIALAKAGYNILLTPHIAGGAITAVPSERVQEYTTILHHLNGQPLRYRIV
jgi:phosphoglycerate dehydrogenase-like enzyme